MRRSIEGASTAVYSIGLSPYRRIQSWALNLRSRINQISMFSRTRDHRIRGGTRVAPSNPVAAIPQTSQMSGYARRVLASQGMLDPNVALVEKPFSEAELMGTATQVLNGHFRGFTTIQSDPA